MIGEAFPVSSCEIGVRTITGDGLDALALQFDDNREMIGAQGCDGCGLSNLCIAESLAS